MNKNKLNWIKGGEMNGDNEGIMQALLTSLPEAESMSAKEIPQYGVAIGYMAELWLRGISKQDFTEWVERQESLEDGKGKS